jgi:hypothetical protein
MAISFTVEHSEGVQAAGIIERLLPLAFLQAPDQVPIDLLGSDSGSGTTAGRRQFEEA